MDCDVQRPSTLSGQLRFAASNGQLDKMCRYLQAGATLDVDQAGYSALHYAAVKGQVDASKLLIERGCGVNSQDNNGYTALHHAASQGHVGVVTVLLEHGCVVDLQNEDHNGNKHGNAAIHEAAWNGFSNTLELLVKFDANVSIVNTAGFSALHLSAQNGHNESTRVLLYAGCDSDIKNNYGDTTLHTAARYGHAGVTRILISARAKLNEQNKNGDTALHIAAALKRRKIAKLLLQSGIDLSIRNKQNETAVDVARRKEHEDIVTLIQAFCWPTKEINIKNNVCDVERPQVMPDQDLPQKKDGKAEKGKRFLFFKKNKSKEKEKNPTTSHGAVPQRSGTTSNITTCEQPVQGFFSKYVPKAGVQYYRDLAGTIKQGPIGYTPTCNCLPTIPQSKRQPDDTRGKVYGQMLPTNQVIQEHSNHMNHRVSMPAQALQKYTQDQLVEEEKMRQHRINEDNYYVSRDENVKSQIQNWLVQKLEGYGHCLDHHHDDTALPNENIFSEVHETANGRLFKSRSDETLSQSDNHSVRNRKRDFYESRQEAMQQIRAWQVPRYSRDRNKLKVYENQPASNRNNNELQKQSLSRNQANIDQEPTRQYPIEPKIDVHTSRIANPQYLNEDWPDSDGAGHRNDVKQAVRVNDGLNIRQNKSVYWSSKHDNSAYMTITASSSERVPDRPAAPAQPQSYQCSNNVAGQSGLITHSVPYSQQSRPYSGQVIGQTGHVLPVNKSNTKSVLPVLSDGVYNSNIVQDSFVTASADLNMGKYSTMSQNSALTQRTQQYPPVNAAMAITNYKGSTSSDKFLAEHPTPTFTTFGYCDTDYGHTASVNIAEQNVDAINNSTTNTQKSDTPRSNISGHSSNVDQDGSIPLTGNGIYSSPRPQTKFGLTQRHPDDIYTGMFNSKLNQKTHSSEVLLETDIKCAYKSKSEECIKESTSSFQLANTAQSSSSGLNIQSSNGHTVRNMQSLTHSQNTCAPFSAQNSYTRSMTSPQVAPKPNICIQWKSYSPTSVMDVQKGNNIISTSPQVALKPNNNIQSKLYSDTSLMDVHKVTGVQKDEYQHVDRTHNVTVKADEHSAKPHYRPSIVAGFVNSVTTHLEPRSKTAYQTYLTENPQCSNFPTTNIFKRETSDNVREISPNVCDLQENSPNNNSNNSKEDCSSNPDSGYGSKIYGNLLNNSSTLPTNCDNMPYLSGSIHRGLTTGTNGNHLINNDSTLPTNCDAPYLSGSTHQVLTSGTKPSSSHSSNAMYQCLPNPIYNDVVDAQVSSWYQCKLKETTQKVYDSWRSERSPGNINYLQNSRHKFGERYSGNTDYQKFNQSDKMQNVGQNFSQSNRLLQKAQNGTVASSFVVRGSDV